jgi:hypothetical protein
MPGILSLTNGTSVATETSVSISADEAAMNNCYLGTIGRVSERMHEIEIWFAVDPERMDVLYLLSGGRDRSDWVRNIRCNPAVRVRVGESIFSGIGHWAAEASVEDARAREIVATKYSRKHGEGDLSGWARTSLPVVVVLTAKLEG